VIRRVSSMRQLIWVGLMMVLLTACTSKVVEFDGFDPTTATLKWLIKKDNKK